MTPQFANAVDPLFVYVLDLLDRISRSDPVSAEEEHSQILTLIDQAEANLGVSPEWLLAKYALVSWIDEMLVDTPWTGREWWSNNVLEVELFHTRLCNEQFYVKAQDASSLRDRDPLEVFYNCVVLGFRGLYRDPELARVLTRAHRLPPDLETWARQTALGVRLGQGRPPLARPRRDIRGAPPLRTRTHMIWAWLFVLILATWNVIFYKLYLSG